MTVYLNRTLPCFSCIVLVACLGKVGHSAGAPLGTHILNGKGLKYGTIFARFSLLLADKFP